MVLVLFIGGEVESGLCPVIIFHKGAIKIKKEQNLFPAELHDDLLSWILVILDLINGNEHAFGV